MHHSACMHQKHLLRFIKSKLKKRPHEVVIFRDGKYLTLLEVFQSLQLTGSAPRACLPGPRACLSEPSGPQAALWQAAAARLLAGAGMPRALSACTEDLARQVRGSSWRSRIGCLAA